jgi:hypothetical protein
MLESIATSELSFAPGADRRAVPFYGSYASFMRTIAALKERGIPKRINPRSLAPYIGNEGKRISTHFASMEWADEHDKPTEVLTRLVGAFGTDAWKGTLSEVIHRYYAFVPQPWADLTGDQLHESFLSHTGREAKVLVPSETFFLSLALEAGEQLPDRLYLRAARAHSEMAKRTKVYAEEAEDAVAMEAETEAAAPVKIEHKIFSPPSGKLTLTGKVPELSIGSQRVDLILKLSTLLSDATLTDQERKAVGITISVLGRTNAA